jgi:hypothetical protein
MVIRRNHAKGSQAWLMIELLAALALLTSALLPLAYSISSERRLARAQYHHAVAMEIVDGEFETLVAGEWQLFPEGTNPYPVKARAATNLPPGAFVLIRQPHQLRLEWRDASQHPIVWREVKLP